MMDSLTGKAYSLADSGEYTAKQLRLLQKYHYIEFSKLLANEDWDEAMAAAYEHQKFREAAERLEGKPQHFK